ncbi:MAG: dTDP-glucose 4,6-dehydratase [Leptolyngbyaceae cyanobacterium CSU_1_3]|nr:dTDP-glucose 4,6-dehydratase [Leptolyngbyaceae cyanobacterium CSU_1_3]
MTSRSPDRILVTGGAGFIGSNFVHHWSRHYPTDRLVVLDALTYAGNRANLVDLEAQSNFRFVKGNICDRALVDSLLQDENIQMVAHLAAESHVDRSIVEPDAFIQTNLVGTFTLLEAFRQHWQQQQNETMLFLHVSTDEVYGDLGEDDPAFSEATAYAPNSPYSASKAGSDHLVRAYHHTYRLPTIVTHCSNNYGEYQFPEKLIPLICVNILRGKPLPIYGDGQNIRDWLYVGDHCRALDLLSHAGRSGETYTIGGDSQIRNIDLVLMICDLMDELAPSLPIRPSRELITFVADRPGHDRRYAINAAKLKTELGWLPQESIATGLRKTLTWYLHHFEP